MPERAESRCGSRRRCPNHDDQVWVFWYGSFGYIVVSGDHVHELGYLALMAETGAPLN